MGVSLVIPQPSPFEGFTIRDISMTKFVIFR